VTWEVIEHDRVESDIDRLVFGIEERYGSQAATYWHDALMVAIQSLGDFPGPRSFPPCLGESERRRAEVRVRSYRGSDGKSSSAWLIFFAVYGETQSTPAYVHVLRVLPAAGEEAATMLSDN
jgi:plasmid stabilization system protein ParE